MPDAEKKLFKFFEQLLKLSNEQKPVIPPQRRPTIKKTWLDQQAKTNLESAIYHKFQMRSKFEPWVKVNLLQSNQKLRGSND